MPVRGFPDADRHRICFRCRRWFEPEEGEEFVSESAAGSFLRSFGIPVTGDLRKRFMCHRCRRIRRITKTAVFVALALALGAALLLGFWSLVKALAPVRFWATPPPQ